MLIIDEYAESKLAKVLEAIQPQANTTVARCIHFKLADALEAKTIVEDASEHVIAAARQHIASANPEMYVCADGDIFILVQALSGKDARKMIADVASQLGLPATDALAGFYELSQHVNKLLLLLEQKTERRRTIAEAIQKQQEVRRAENKRRSILEKDISAQNPHAIATRRKQRSKPELMIIEDDAFSRRLLETALEKQYALTGLGTADLALATYAHLAPDVLFLDINLPDVTGHDLLKKIIAFDPDAYVIMLSGNADRENITQAMSEGAKGFVAKPFNREKICQYIERCPTIRQ